MGMALRKPDGRTFLRGDFSRNLLIISVVIVILLPIYNAAFIYPVFKRLFADTTAQDATNIAKYFMEMFTTETNDLVEHPLDHRMLEEVSTLKTTFGLTKLRIFSKSGEILFSTDSSEIGTTNTESYFKDVVSQGRSFTKIVKKGTESLEHQRMPVDVVETYVPLMKDGAFLGAFEIYYDITEKEHNLNRLLLISFIIVVMLALGVLIISIVNIVKEKRITNERRRSYEEKERLITELQSALAEVKTLSGLLPICASCKKIRDDQGYWNQIEDYVSRHSAATFSHGICPDCAKRLYPDIAKAHGL